MMYVKTPGKITIMVTAMAVFFLSLHLSGWFPRWRGNSRPIVTGDLAFQIKHNSNDPLRVAIYPGAGFAPGIQVNGGLNPTRDSDQNNEDTVNIEFILEENPDSAMRLLEDTSGADLVWSTVPLLSYGYQKYRHLNPVAVMLYGWSRGEEVLFADQRVRDISWLKGKTVACVEGGNAHLMILYLLDTNRIDRREIQWRFTNTDSDAVFLASKKRVRVFGVSNAPEYRIPDGYQPVVSTAQIARLIPGVFVTREDILITHGARIHAFIESWFKSAASLSIDSPELLDLMTRSFQSDESKITKMLESYNLSGYKDNLVFFGIGQAGFAGFDYLMDLSISIWGLNETVIPSCESLKNTTILASLHDILKKTGDAMITKTPESLKRPALERLTAELFIEFPSDSYAPDYKTSRSLSQIARRAHVFTGSSLSLFGVTSSPDDKPYAYHWGMRFYHLTRMLGEYGLQKSVTRIPELRYDASLSGGGKHMMGFFVTPSPD